MIKLVSLDEYNAFKNQNYYRMKNNKPVHNGIACPKCGHELLDTDPERTLLTYPPKKNIHCPKCGYKGHRYV